MHQRAPLSFFLKGIAGLVALFAFTLLMAPRPEVTALRMFIGVGMALVCAKMLFRYANIGWPARRRSPRGDR
ncbi:MAG TPA: hypothetical protein VLV86_07310 [Vicinamibacterales bacterium]|nr:hypothetical protein [Vicinamibacterales bacterium]